MATLECTKMEDDVFTQRYAEELGIENALPEEYTADSQYFHDVIRTGVDADYYDAVMGPNGLEQQALDSLLLADMWLALKCCQGYKLSAAELTELQTPIHDWMVASGYGPEAAWYYDNVVYTEYASAAS